MNKIKPAGMIWQKDIQIVNIFTLLIVWSSLENMKDTCSSNDSFQEMIQEETRLREQGKLCVLAGSYNDGGGIGVPYEVRES